MTTPAQAIRDAIADQPGPQTVAAATTLRKQRVAAEADPTATLVWLVAEQRAQTGSLDPDTPVTLTAGQAHLLWTAILRLALAGVSTEALTQPRYADLYRQVVGNP